METIGERIRALRGELSQAELARRTGYTDSHVSKLENGRCRPSRKFLKAAATALGQPEESLLALYSTTERKQTKRTKRLRDQMKAIRKSFGRPSVLPVPGGRMERIFAEAMWTPEGAALVRELDCLRRPRAFWSAARTVGRGLTGPEQGAWLRLLLPEGLLQELHPHEVRFPYPVVTTPGQRHHAILIPRAGTLVTIHDQVTFLTKVDRLRRLDFLVSAASERVVVSSNLEIDGPTHRGTRCADRARAEEIGLPTLRVRADQVCNPEFPNVVLTWIEDLLTRALAQPRQG